jgi:uncharacterized RDD family membrane protein YckC
MTDRDLQQRRYIAAGIDIAVAIAIGIVFAVVGGVLGFAFSSATSTSMVGVYLPRVISFLGSLVSLAYILGRDILAGDRSIGKKVQNIRVVTVTGQPIGPVESAKRNGIFAIGAALACSSATLGPHPVAWARPVNCPAPACVEPGIAGRPRGRHPNELIQITQRPRRRCVTATSPSQRRAGCALRQERVEAAPAAVVVAPRGDAARAGTCASFHVKQWRAARIRSSNQSGSWPAGAVGQRPR